MKKIVTLALSLLMVTGLSADEYSFDIQTSYLTPSGGDKVLGIEPAEHFVGGSHSRIDLRAGLKLLKEKSLSSVGYLYLAAAPSLNNQISGGVGLKALYKNRYTMNAFAGYGNQRNSGKEFTLDHPITVIGYITGSSLPSGTYKAHYLEDTRFIEIGLTGGLSYEITNNYRAHIDAGFIFSSNQVNYALEGSSQSNQMTIEQFNWIIGIGLSF